MAGFRDRLNDGMLGIVFAAGALVIILAVGWVGIRALTSNPVNELLNSELVFMCSKTGKTFEVELKSGMTIPVRSPYTKENTGYPAERCYWTADGKIKNEPTFVLLNNYRGDKSATYCHDCGRLVKEFNPLPQPGDTPPPLKLDKRKQQK